MSYIAPLTEFPSLSVSLSDTNSTVFSTGVSNLLPGDYLNRYVNMTNGGTVAQSFSGTVNGPGVLGTAMTVQIDTCSVAWTGATCGGTGTSILAATATSPSANFTIPSLAAAGVRYARFQFKLDPLTNVSFQGTSTTQTVTITGGATAANGNDRTAG